MKKMLFEVQGDPSMVTNNGLNFRVIARDFGDAERKYKRFAADPPRDCQPRPSKEVVMIKFIGFVIA